MKWVWEGLVRSIVMPRSGIADRLGVGVEDLLAGARLAAVEADLSWDPQGGRSRSSWVYLEVGYYVSTALSRAQPLAPFIDVRHATDTEKQLQARQVLQTLAAHLAVADWDLLWSHYVRGVSALQLAQEQGVSHGAMRVRICRVRKTAVTLAQLAA
jgi:DNA-directed RNA polymerase specialized sigma24 family protein